MVGLIEQRRPLRPGFLLLAPVRPFDGEAGDHSPEDAQEGLLAQGRDRIVVLRQVVGE